MRNIDKYKEEFDQLVRDIELIYYGLIVREGCADPKKIAALKKLKLKDFNSDYEIWYSEASSIVKLLIPDRYNDFTALYKNEKRKEIDYLTYTISDGLIGLSTSKNGKIIADIKAAINKLKVQMEIFKSIEKRFISSLYDIKLVVQADLFDSEIETARELTKKGFLRGGGAIVGVLLEKHLAEVLSNHSLKSTKKHPTISELNDLLKDKEIINIPTWRFIQHLGDLRNLCNHNKEKEPTKDEVIDLINGVEKIIKTIF